MISWLRARSRPLSIGLAVFAVAAAVFRIARGRAGFWTIDDAGITYAAAFELADHGSLAPYVEGCPLEGYSNPIVFFVTALLRLAGMFDPLTTHLQLEMILFGVMVMLVWALVRAFTGELAGIAAAVMFTTLELLTPSTWIWYGSGLENVWVSAGLIALVWLCMRTARGVPLSPAWGVLGFLVAITRPGSARVRRRVLCRARRARAPRRGRVHRAPAPRRRHARGHRDPVPRVSRLAARGLPPVAAEHVLREAPRQARAAPEPPRLRDPDGLTVRPIRALLAASAIVLVAMPRLRRLAGVLVVMLIAPRSPFRSRPVHPDWMGEQRFATPWLAICHLTYAVCIAALVGELVRYARAKRVATSAVLAVALFPAALVAHDRSVGRDDTVLNEVTIPRVGEGEAGRRWEQQLRLGVPYPVVQIPDAGGTLLVGGMQMLDNGYLTDFQMARIGRNYSRPRDLRVLDQYQHVERRPDLMSENRQFALDRSYLGTRYLPPGEGVLWARRDLVVIEATEAFDPSARLIYDERGVKIFLSDETVRTAAPGALARCEVIVQWSEVAAPQQMKLRGTIDHGRGGPDEIGLWPYQRSDHGIERFALLLSVPDVPGRFDVALDVIRDGQPTSLGRPLAIEVTDSEAALWAAAGELARASSVNAAARHVAWLREQRVPRLDITAFRALIAQLVAEEPEHDAAAGRQILALRDNARLAAYEPLPLPIAVAQGIVEGRMFETCRGTAELDPARRIACLGRAVDQLRRLGDLGIVSRDVELAVQLDAARDALAGWTPEQRYQVLVGLTLARPADVAMQWALLVQRRTLSVSETFPPL